MKRMSTHEANGLVSLLSLTVATNSKDTDMETPTCEPSNKELIWVQDSIPLQEFQYTIKYSWVSMYTCHLILFMRKNTYNGQVMDYSWSQAETRSKIQRLTVWCGFTPQSVRSTLQEFHRVIFVLKETMGCQQHGLWGETLAGWW